MTFWRVWLGSRRPGRCKHCRRPIAWVITEHNQSLPLDPDKRPIRTDRDTAGRRFEIYSSEALHFVTCPIRRTRAALTSA